jgi:hypothetical protein
MPAIDLAVVVFDPRRGPVAANVLFSREHPQGLVADIAPAFGPVCNVQYQADLTDATGVSVLWQPGSDWSRWPLQAIRASAGDGPPGHRFVSPYPASLLKVMVAVGVALGVDSDRYGFHAWEEAWFFDGESRSLAQWAEPMITVSCNRSTSALVAWLHAQGLIVRDEGHERDNALHRHFDAFGLHTLRLADTRPDGGWGNAAGSGVGHIHMTAWDTVRLLWLLDDDAPPAPWLPPGRPPMVSLASRDRIRAWLEDQALHEILSSGVLAGAPGCVPGIPARVPRRWIAEDGSVSAHQRHYPSDVRPATQQAALRFAHKTGTTDNYASDAGIVRALEAASARSTRSGTHYLVAVLTSLGKRYAASPDCATTWRLPALGAAIDATVSGVLAETGPVA